MIGVLLDLYIKYNTPHTQVLLVFSCSFGFVEFEDVEIAEKSKADKDGLEIHGREVQLAFANDKPGGMSGASGRGGGTTFFL